MKLATVQYQIATYSGTIDVNIGDDDDENTIIARAKAHLIRKSGGSLPYGYQHFQILKIINEVN